MLEDDAELPQRALDWVLAAVPGARRIQRAARLHGGLSAHTHLLEVERSHAGEPPLELVLKRFKPKWADPPVVVEADVLRAVAAAALPFSVPAPLAQDPLAQHCDLPAILMTRARGQIALSLDDWPSRVRALGRTLAAFHAANVPCPASVDAYEVEESRREKHVPDAIVTPDWSRVWELVLSRPFRGTALIHGDYHIGNALFEGSELTGIIDWTTARRGPTEFDVSYCRMDLALVLGEAAPDIFSSAYEDARGEELRELALWDLAASVQAYPDAALWLPGWVDAGRTDLTSELVRARLKDFVDGALLRVAMQI
ncbi:MAG TPA: aminoglycoside phosphotransferase family protein [Polyangiaceae bacterium]|nr:aminoglycoside phosphotransferase family protein [Polyangiaceae bacterium]